MANRPLVGLNTTGDGSLGAVVPADTGTLEKLKVGAADNVNCAVYSDANGELKTTAGMTNDGTNVGIPGALTVGGSAAVGSLTIGGSPIPTPQNINSLARQVSIAMTAAASGSNGIQALSNTNLNMGTNDFTIVWRGELPDWTPATFKGLFRKYKDTAPFIGYSLGIGASGGGAPYVTLYRSDAGTTFNATVTPDILDAAIAEIAVSITRESSILAGSIVFYVNGVQIGSSVPISSASAVSLDNATSAYISGTSSVRNASTTLDVKLYNRALSATEVLSLYNNGPALADLASGTLTPSQTPVTTYDFSSGVDGFLSGGSTTLTGNVDGIGGKDNTLRALSGGASAGRFVRTYSNSQLLKNGRLVLEFYRPSANATVSGVQLRLTNGTSTSSPTTVASVQIPADTWTKVVFKVPPTTSESHTAFSFYFIDAADSVNNNTSGDMIYMASGGTYTTTGVTAWWNAADCQSNTGQVFDRSGNNSHALLPAAGATRIPQNMSGQVSWTNTWAGTSELQYVSGVNQAILPTETGFIVMDMWSTGSITVNIGDGANSSRFGSSVALVAGPNRVTFASPFTDGTNRKLTIDPSGNFTGSITTSATFQRVRSS